MTFKEIFGFDFWCYPLMLVQSETPNIMHIEVSRIFIEVGGRLPVAIRLPIIFPSTLTVQNLPKPTQIARKPNIDKKTCLFRTFSRFLKGPNWFLKGFQGKSQGFL